MRRIFLVDTQQGRWGGATGVPLKRMYFSAKKTAVKEIEEEVEEAPPEVDSECGSDRDC